MPIMNQNRRPWVIEKGSLTADALVDGQHSAVAVQAAAKNFEEEHGREPDWTRVQVLLTFTTFHTVAWPVEVP